MSIYIAVHFLIDEVYNHPNISVVLSVSTLLLWLAIRRPRDIPPNPWFIFPIIGHRPLLRGDPIQILRRLRREYGDVCSVYIDAQLVIVVNGLAAIKEAFLTRGEEFHWRPNTRTCDLFHFGVICNSGREWREQRRVTELGLEHVSSHVGVLVHKEAVNLIAALKEETGKPINAKVILHAAVLNALTSIIFSRRLDYKDVLVDKVVTRFTENLDLFSDSKFPNYFPFQKFLMGDFFDVKFLRMNMAEIHQKVISPVFEEHQEEYKDDKLADFLDVYLREIKAHKNVKGTTVEEKSCQAVLYDLLWHGSTTTAATLYWALVFMLRNKEMTEKVRQQVEDTLSAAVSDNNGAGVESLKESPELPALVRAFTHEVQRSANIMPLSMAHAVAKEKFLKGYRIPADAVILPNLDSLMMDDDIWGDAKVFRPERFINADGKLSIFPEFIPFFIGIRKCPAAGIAQAILSTFLAYIMFHFDLEPESAAHLPPIERKRGLIPMPADFKTKFVARR